MKVLAEPLLPHAKTKATAEAGSAKGVWQHAFVLLWRTARPRTYADVVIILVVLVLLTAAKVLHVALPLVLRSIVNSLSLEPSEQWSAIWLVGLFCGLTVATEAFSQLQEAVFARLFYRISQRVTVMLFAHLQALSLRWHLTRRTGEVLTVMSQGVGAVGNLLQIVTFQISATLLELLLTSGVFYRIGVPAISLCVLAGATVYTGHTVLVTRLRTQQRRAQNAAAKASTDVVVDSLLNFETVKVCASEAAETARLDGIAGELARLQIILQDSLSCMNCGQTAAMQLGMLCGLLVACSRTATREMSVGDFVMCAARRVVPRRARGEWAPAASEPASRLLRPLVRSTPSLVGSSYISRSSFSRSPIWAATTACSCRCHHRHAQSCASPLEFSRAALPS